MKCKKGQMGANILSGMILLVIIATIGITSLTVYNSVQTSLRSSLSSTTAEAGIVFDNFTVNTYNGYDLVSNVPIVIAAGLLISVILGFALIAR